MSGLLTDAVFEWGLAPIGFAVAAVLFAGLIAWRVVSGVRVPAQRLVLAGFALTACWAWLSALASGSILTELAETFRNFAWLALLHSLSGGREMVERQRGVRLVYGAAAGVLGLQVLLGLLPLVVDDMSTLVATSDMLRITAAAGLLVLVHNLYASAEEESRQAIALTMLALVATWGYELNFYTLSYLDPYGTGLLFDLRGVAVVATAPLFALGAGQAAGWRIRLSRDATFQSVSLVAICAYFALMSILATALGRSGVDWIKPIIVLLLAAMVVAAVLLVPSPRARAWAKVKLNKHFFEHRYDYRVEWLRFAETIGRAGENAAPLGQRIVKAFADIVEAPGGLLLIADQGGHVGEAARWNWPGGNVIGDELDPLRWTEIQQRGQLLDLEALRNGSTRGGIDLPLPEWLEKDEHGWAAVPLIHGEKMEGLVILAFPPVRRTLDWEDFDLLKTAGRQAAATLAEAHGQAALARSQRFDEFNRRFAFILHDIKNIVSQLSLVARNAERHADNPEFRADMVATLKSSVAKMNDLLARLGPANSPRSAKLEPANLRSLVASAIAGMRSRHDIRLSGDGSHFVLVDPLLFEQALGHLVSNAIDASPTEEPVEVKMAGDDERVTVAVIDHGAGMDADFIRDRLFEPFASTKDGGFGIGAFEARSLITSMNGRVTVESRPGAGTRFMIHLPTTDAIPATTDERKIA